jgi:hypothetical protein
MQNILFTSLYLIDDSLDNARSISFVINSIKAIFFSFKEELLLVVVKGFLRRKRKKNSDVLI